VRNPMRNGPPAHSSAPELLPQPLGDPDGDEVLDPSAERRKFLDAARGEKTVLRTGHQVGGLYLGILSAGELVHLELVLEVRDRAQALDDRLGAHAASELDDEDREGLGADALQTRGRLLDEVPPPLD